MASPFKASNFEDDDLSRQRRKREARLLDQPVPGFPGSTVADVVAEVLAARDESHLGFSVPMYLAKQGHDWQTIDAVISFLQRQELHPAGSGEAWTGVTDISRSN